mgnify:CR=1 FL=1
MSKILTFLLVVVLLLALLCSFTGATFNLKAYADNLDDLPQKPALPDWSNVVLSFDKATTIQTGLQALGGFFEFVIDCLAYPFQFIGYIVKTVFVLSNGMLERG